jgi:7-cyano-7-deazaguanine synthase
LYSQRRLGGSSEEKLGWLNGKTTPQRTSRRLLGGEFRNLVKAASGTGYLRADAFRFFSGPGGKPSLSNTVAEKDRTEGVTRNVPVAIVLLSGGLDSATTLAIARSQGYSCRALSFEYGQRHRCELEAARRVALAQGATEHHWIRLDLGRIGGSALTASEIAVPKAPRPDVPWESNPDSIPVTYVPARNTIFLAYALALAEVHGSYDIFVGANAVDYSGYPDCRPEFFRAFERVAELGTRAGAECNDAHRFRIHAPLLQMPKTEIIEVGLQLGVDYSMTHSCYDPLDETGTPCRRCDACRIRHTAFRQLGMEDPQLSLHASRSTDAPNSACHP